ncbi:malonate transporter subunit MadM, partial [Cobetia marina]
MIDSLVHLFDKYHLVAAFAVIGLAMYVAYWISNHLTRGKLHGSAIAIILGLVL